MPQENSSTDANSATRDRTAPAAILLYRMAGLGARARGWFVAAWQHAVSSLSQQHVRARVEKKTLFEKKTLLDVAPPLIFSYPQLDFFLTICV